MFIASEPATGLSVGLVVVVAEYKFLYNRASKTLTGP